MWVAAACLVVAIAIVALPIWLIYHFLDFFPEPLSEWKRKNNIEF